MAEDDYIRMRGTVVEVLRDATFKVEIEGGLEVMARPSGRMRRGRIIRILPGDQVDVEVSTYDPTKGRIVIAWCGDSLLASRRNSAQTLVRLRECCAQLGSRLHRRC